MFATLAAVLVVDRIGRRLTLLIGVGVMVASNALMVVVCAPGQFLRRPSSALGFIGLLISRFFLTMLPISGDWARSRCSSASP